ncbi:hypothetical protein [Singulisphaera sp. PoT]|uniref:hypothetical protein n=1 Tax=Singulisphaera sp. PoT TaxID=3411797 RepID=UPI003BF4A23F
MPMRQFSISRGADDTGEYAIVSRLSDGIVFVRVPWADLPRDEFLAVIELQSRLAVTLEEQRLREAIAAIARR